MKPNSPKIVYLDQMAWIYLSQGYHSINKKFSEAARSAIEASERQEAIFPLCLTRFAETIKYMKHQERRQRLGEFMVKLSKGNTMAPSTYVRDLEIMNACIQVAGAPRINLTPWVFRKGLSHMMGSSGPEIVAKDLDQATIQMLNQKFSEALMDPNAFLLLVKKGLDKANTQRLMRTAIASVQIIEEIRRQNAGMSRAERYKFELAVYFSKSLLPKLIDYMQKKGINPMLLDPIIGNKDRLIQFFRTIPTSYCFFELVLFRDMQPRRKVYANDMLDLISLSPCDILL